jgi:hypothetical protein
MKHFLLCTTLCIAATALSAQQPATQTQPKSPAAVELSPPNTGGVVYIKYSSPRLNGRAGHIFTKDGVISHDKNYPIWRAGANAATLLHVETEMIIGDPAVHLSKGDYSLFVDISDPDNWVLIVNKQTGQSGLAYDPSQNLAQAKMAMDTLAQPVENLKYTLKSFGGSSTLLTLTLSWENHSGSVLFSVK